MTNFLKTRFVVVHGDTLCSTIPGDPLSGQILSTLICASRSWLDGTCCFPLDPAWVASDDCPKPLDLAKVREGTQEVKFDPAQLRPATRSDFETFRLSAKGYARDTEHYDFPKD